MPPKTRKKTSKVKKATKTAKRKVGRGAKARAGAGNVDKLVKAGVLDASNMSPRHRKIIDSKLTAGEVKALIKAKKLLSPRGHGPWTLDADGAAF
jgi:hypothetical protein